MNSTIFWSVGKDEIPILYSLILEFAIFEQMESKLNISFQALEISFEEKIIHAYLIVFEGNAVGFILYEFGNCLFSGKKTITLENIYVKSEYRKFNLAFRFKNLLKMQKHLIVLNLNGEVI